MSYLFIIIIIINIKIILQGSIYISPFDMACIVVVFEGIIGVVVAVVIVVVGVVGIVEEEEEEGKEGGGFDNKPSSERRDELEYRLVGADGWDRREEEG